MPIYEYRCPACEHEFEDLVKVDAAAPPCPGCGDDGAVRKVSKTSFVLKGGGWYKDLYSGPSNQSGAPSSSSESSSSSADSSSDSSDSSDSSSSSSSSDSSSSSSTSSSSSDD